MVSNTLKLAGAGIAAVGGILLLSRSGDGGIGSNGNVGGGGGDNPFTPWNEASGQSFQEWFNSATPNVGELWNRFTPNMPGGNGNQLIDIGGPAITPPAQDGESPSGDLPQYPYSGDDGDFITVPPAQDGESPSGDLPQYPNSGGDTGGGSGGNTGGGSGIGVPLPGIGLPTIPENPLPNWEPPNIPDLVPSIPTPELPPMPGGGGGSNGGGASPPEDRDGESASGDLPQYPNTDTGDNDETVTVGDGDNQDSVSVGGSEDGNNFGDGFVRPDFGSGGGSSNDSHNHTGGWVGPPGGGL